MAQELVINHPTCSGCAGTGLQPIHPGGARPCPMCDGTGKQIYARITIDPGLDDLMDKLNDIKEKVDEIKKKVDAL